MSVKYLDTKQLLQGPDDEKDGELDSVVFGAEYFAEDTGITYQKVASHNPHMADWKRKVQVVQIQQPARTPLPVTVEGQIVGKTVAIGPVQIPGIGTGSAYADLDAFGTVFTISVPKSGIIQTALYFDLDNEGLMMDLWLFKGPFLQTADNAALVVSDIDLLSVETVISFSNFKAGNTGQVAVQSGLGIAYVAPDGVLYCQMQARGAVNIAAANLPSVSLRILSD